MTKQEIHKVAKEYVDRQLENMTKNGLKTKKVSDEEYQRLIKQIEAAVVS